MANFCRGCRQLWLSMNPLCALSCSLFQNLILSLLLMNTSIVVFLILVNSLCERLLLSEKATTKILAYHEWNSIALCYFSNSVSPVVDIETQILLNELRSFYAMEKIVGWMADGEFGPSRRCRAVIPSAKGSVVNQEGLIPHPLLNKQGERKDV